MLTPSDSVPQVTCIIETTVLTSTLEELTTINNFMIGAERIETLGTEQSRMVLFYNEARDTILVREANLGSDETYKMYVNSEYGVE